MKKIIYLLLFPILIFSNGNVKEIRQTFSNEIQTLKYISKKDAILEVNIVDEFCDVIFEKKEYLNLIKDEKSEIEKYKNDEIEIEIYENNAVLYLNKKRVDEFKLFFKGIKSIKKSMYQRTNK